jgi:hypothetical protein
LKVAKYTGVKDNSKFDDYCTNILTAHNEFKRLNVPVDGPSQVIEFLQGIKQDDFQGMKAGIMSKLATAGDLGAASKAIKKQVKAFFPNINPPGRVYIQRGNDQRQINAAGRHAVRQPFNNQHNNQRNRQRNQNNQGRGGGRGPGQRVVTITKKDDGLWIPHDIFHLLTPKQRSTYYQGCDTIRKRGPDSSVDTRQVSKQTWTEPT